MRLPTFVFVSLCASTVSCSDPESPPAEPSGGSTADGGGGAAPVADGGNGGSGGSELPNDDWLDVDWPTASVDAITAGQLLFDESLQNRWDLALGPDDESCPASDCPGGAPDPILGDDFEVYGYAGFFEGGQSVGARYPLRSLTAEKNSDSTMGGPGVGRGVGVSLFRRSADGALVILTESELLLGEDLTFREDFGTFALQHDDSGTRIVLYPPPFLPSSPLTEDERQALELYFFFAADDTLTFRTAGQSIDTMGFAFKANKKTASPALPESGIVAELGDPDTTDARLLEIVGELTTPGLLCDGSMAALELVAHHPSEEVGIAALDYVKQCYLDPNHGLSRRYMDDRMMAQLLYAPSAAARAAAATTQAEIRATWPAIDYHCSVEQALEHCANAESDAGTQSVCSDLLASLGPGYGQCPLPWPL